MLLAHRKFKTMKSITSIGISLFALIFMACGGGQSADQNEQKVAEVTQSLPAPIFDKLQNECDYVDYIFYDLPISFSQSDVGGIRQMLQFIENETTDIPPSCKPTARLAFLAAGDIIIEADLYFMEDCALFVFLENDSPKYIHKLSAAGKTYYHNILDNYFEAIEQQQPQGQ